MQATDPPFILNSVGRIDLSLQEAVLITSYRHAFISFLSGGSLESSGQRR